MYTLFFLFLLKNDEAVLTSTHNLCFEQKCEKYQNFLSENFQIFWKWHSLDFSLTFFSIYLNRRIFVMFILNTHMFYLALSSTNSVMSVQINNNVVRSNLIWFQTTLYFWIHGLKCDITSKTIISQSFRDIASEFIRRLPDPITWIRVLLSYLQICYGGFREPIYFAGPSGLISRISVCRWQV